MNINGVNFNATEEEKNQIADFEEAEWEVLGEDIDNPLVSNVKEIATSGYRGTNVRVDQIGPFRIAFRTPDDLSYRIDYDSLYSLTKPLQDFLGLPIYIGGSNSPLSKKVPNRGSDIDIYVITDGYSYEESKKLSEVIDSFLGENPKYDKCSIGQVEKEWLEFPYFYESVPIDERIWWELGEEEIERAISARKKASIERVRKKTRKEVLDDIQRIYGIHLKEEDIIGITTTPRWKSTNDCSFRRASLINQKEDIDLSRFMDRMDFWLRYPDEGTSLYDAIMDSTTSREYPERVDTMCTYINKSYKNGKHWMFNSVLNSIGEAFASDTTKMYWLIDKNDEEAGILIEQIEHIVETLSNHFGRKIDNEFVDLNEYFEQKGYTEKIEELKKVNRKYRRVCDLDLETKLYAFSRLHNSGKLFIINPDRRVGKMLKHSGLRVVVPFLNKNLEDMGTCPTYAKKPPAGYCLTGAKQLMFGISDTYKCACGDENAEKEFSDVIQDLWKKFDTALGERGGYQEATNGREFSIFDKSKDSRASKAIILFGAPSIDFKNLVLLRLAKNYSEADTTVVVEDTMAPYLYRDGVYDSEAVKELYNALADNGVKVEFNSEDPGFNESVIRWLKQLKIKDLKKLLPLTANGDVFGFHVYDALHLAVMGATQEKVKEKIGIVHAYNETALHIFNEKIGNPKGYISCHQVPEGKVRLLREHDLDEVERVVDDELESIDVLFKDKNGHLTSRRKINRKSERDEGKNNGER